MDITKVCVIGGSGFVGRHVVHLLAARGLTVRVPSRHRERAKELLVLPTVVTVQVSVMLGATVAVPLARAVQRGLVVLA